MSIYSYLVISVGHAGRDAATVARADYTTRAVVGELGTSERRVVVALDRTMPGINHGSLEAVHINEMRELSALYDRLGAEGAVDVIVVGDELTLAELGGVWRRRTRWLISIDAMSQGITQRRGDDGALTEIGADIVDGGRCGGVLRDLLPSHPQPTIQKRMALLTTWNQRCGLAAYIKDVVAELPVDTFVVYAEQGVETLAPDEAFVRRVWSREHTDFNELAATIERDEIGLLHINCKPGILPSEPLSDFIRTIRQRGVRVFMTLHTVYSCEEGLGQLVRAVDAVCVHFPESRLEAIANGADPAHVHVVPLGVRSDATITPRERAELRQSLGIQPDETVIGAFGFVHTHKGMEGVIEAVERLKSRGMPARGFIVGSPQPGSEDGARYLKYLKGAALHCGVADRIQFVDHFVSDVELRRFVGVTDIALFNYRGDYYEASAACALALGAGCVVVTSVAPQFVTLGDAVWHSTAGYTIADSVELISTNPQLAGEIRRSADAFCAEHRWSLIVKRVLDLYRRYDFKPTVQQAKESTVARNESAVTDSGTLRVLMQNRPNTLTQRGGDTVVIERLKAGLEARGVAVTLDLTGTADPRDFDIVHLFNFVLADMIRAHGERAQRSGIPFVVTTLNEDVPSFHNQSISTARALIEYTQRGQDSTWWESVRKDLTNVAPCAPFDNSWTARNASLLMTNGERESAVLRRMYTDCAPIAEVRLGHEVNASADPGLFERAYGVKDFILCVGRIESRKNQLMVLKALEKIDLPVVLASGGFSYQPDYDRAVRSFQRSGRTIVVDRLSPEMLASAYAAARIHVLASWYELPGLVSLEAASYGKNVVVTDRGTTWDYFGETAFYCDPSEERSIANAVLAAYHAPVRAGVREIACAARWDHMIDETLGHYERIVGKASRGVTQRASIRTDGAWCADTQQEESMKTGNPVGVSDLSTLLEEGEAAARAHEYNRAQELLEQAERLDGSSIRALRARGAVFLAEGKIARAEEYFRRALALEQNDPKTLSGLGMCAMQAQSPETAHGYLVKALDIAPDQLVAMLQLIECSYALERFDALETALRRYITQHPEDVDMRYCLAGCLFKMGRHHEAQSLNEAVLNTRPDHAGAQQLRELLKSASKTPVVEEAIKTVPPEVPLISKIETEVVGPTRTSRPGRGSFGIEESADGAIGAIEELKHRGDFDAMKKSCTELLSRAGLSPEQTERATVLQAEAELLTGEFAKGQRLYDQVLTRNPVSARALSGKGALAAHEGDWVAAREYFERALKTQPSFDVALAGMGLCADHFGESDTAFDFYTRATRANPENTRAIFGLMEVGYRTRRFTEMEEALKGYLELHAADLDFVYSLAGCLYAQGKHSEALEAVSRIELFEPNNERALELRRAIEGAVMGSLHGSVTR
jgi:glycosyltransferase involved in cell wall biosynthesis/tetratricopeptide (TPR) repeat protein